MAQQRINQQLALEMTMQDVMGNMEELALEFGFGGSSGCLEILAIEPTEVSDAVEVDRSSRLRSPYSAALLNLNTDNLFRVA